MLIFFIIGLIILYITFKIIFGTGKAITKGVSSAITTKKCPHCNSRISVKAKVCPECHRDIVIESVNYGNEKETQEVGKIKNSRDSSLEELNTELLSIYGLVEDGIYNNEDLKKYKASYFKKIKTLDYKESLHSYLLQSKAIFEKNIFTEEEIKEFKYIVSGKFKKDIEEREEKEKQLRIRKEKEEQLKKKKEKERKRKEAKEIREKILSKNKKKIKTFITENKYKISSLLVLVLLASSITYALDYIKEKDLSNGPSNDQYYDAFMNYTGNKTIDIGKSTLDLDKGNLTYTKENYDKLDVTFPDIEVKANLIFEEEYTGVFNKWTVNFIKLEAEKAIRTNNTEFINILPLIDGDKDISIGDKNLEISKKLKDLDYSLEFIKQSDNSRSFNYSDIYALSIDGLETKGKVRVNLEFQDTGKLNMLNIKDIETSNISELPLRVAMFKEDSLIGYISSFGEVVLPPKYSNAYDFNEYGTALVKENGKWNLIDIRGKKLIDTNSDDLLKFPDGSELFQIGKNIYHLDGTPFKPSLSSKKLHDNGWVSGTDEYLKVSLVYDQNGNNILDYDNDKEVVVQYPYGKVIESIDYHWFSGYNYKYYIDGHKVTGVSEKLNSDFIDGLRGHVIKKTYNNYFELINKDGRVLSKVQVPEGISLGSPKYIGNNFIMYKSYKSKYDYSDLYASDGSIYRDSRFDHAINDYKENTLLYRNKKGTISLVDKEFNFTTLDLPAYSSNQNSKMYKYLGNWLIKYGNLNQNLLNLALVTDEGEIVEHEKINGSDIRIKENLIGVQNEETSKWSIYNYSNEKGFYLMGEYSDIHFYEEYYIVVNHEGNIFRGAYNQEENNLKRNRYNNITDFKKIH